MNTQDGSGLWGYHDNSKITMFSETVDIKKVVTKLFLILSML